MTDIIKGKRTLEDQGIKRVDAVKKPAVKRTRFVMVKNN